jgi:hypothetical protein
MFFQTGSVIGRSFTSEGDMNPGKVPTGVSAPGRNFSVALHATF